MTENAKKTEKIEKCLNQIAVARTEIRNLRNQLTSLKQEQQKAFKFITTTLAGLRCVSCSEQEATVLVSQNTIEQQGQPSDDNYIKFRPIGTIETVFQNKRAVPRQPNVLETIQGTLVLDPTVFNNPGHALSSLEEFSHIWIIFHFHSTESNKVPAKVAPPRLGGEKRGVFSTRSPHRPCPIGLSLVKLHSIEGNRINFLGVDMVNGTPVLDIKPYIPKYDYPSSYEDGLSTLTRPPTEGISNSSAPTNLIVDDIGADARSLSPHLTNPLGLDINSPSRSPFEDIPSPGTNNLTPVSPSIESPSSVELLEGNRSPIQRLDSERGAPDGQERFTPPQSTQRNVNDGIRIASWISNPTQIYEVRFTNDALNRLNELIGERAESFKATLEGLLSEDPRSQYVRSRYPDHEYSCVLEDLSISCVFDSNSSVCTIVALRNADELQQS